MFVLKQKVENLMYSSKVEVKITWACYNDDRCSKSQHYAQYVISTLCM